MPTAKIATAAALLFAGKDQEEFQLVTTMFLSLLTGFLTIAAICGYILWQAQPPKPPKSQRRR